MAQRRFGPTLGAGVVVIEKDGDKPIQPASLGVTAMVGILEKGPIGKLIPAALKTDFLARAGAYIPESLLPDAALDFYNLANGAGELWLGRVTDGTERVATLTLKSRELPHRDVLRIDAGNGGRWAGKAQFVAGAFTSNTQTTLTTGKTWLKNEFKDATLTLGAVPGKSYKVLSNTTGGVITLAPDAKLTTDLAGSSDMTYGLELKNGGKEITVVPKDGITDPVNLFGLEVYVDGALTKVYDDLSMDPDSPNYVVGKINDTDESDYIIKVASLLSGTSVPATRPAAFYRKVKTVTSLVVTADVFDLATSSVGGAVASTSAFSYGGAVKKQKVTLTCTAASPGAATFSVVSDLLGALSALTEGVAYTALGQFGFASITLSHVASTEFGVGDVVTIDLDPFVVNALKGSVLVPDYLNEPKKEFLIDSNTVNTITVKAGNDLTTVAAVSDEFLVRTPLALAGGYDGVEDITDAKYTPFFDSSTSIFNNLRGKGLGLVKLCVPGVASTVVQKAGVSYAESRNYQFRAEIPSGTTTEDGADAYVNDTLGRSDFLKVSFPSYCKRQNPQAAGLKLVSMSGMILGREAKMAKDFDGYFKAAAGIDVTLPDVVSLTTGDKILNEERLNPRGINVIKKKKGNFIVWGDRLPSIDPNFKFAHQREQLSHYENIFLEEFDFIVFALNDPTRRDLLLVSFRTFFIPEFAKGAIRGKDLDDAVLVKIDDENNPEATVVLGDLNAQIKLRLAETVERFIITIGKAGIFESFG